MTLDVPLDDVILGITHLQIGGELIPLFKCPFCPFKNIHEAEVIHHIRYKEDSKHAVDVDKIDKKRYIVSKQQNASKYHYEKMEDLPLPWINCFWCDYKTKIKSDLARHFVEVKNHRDRLYRIKVSPEERRDDPVWTHDPFSWMYSDLDYRIFKIMKQIEEENDIG